jgi:hypothetical protein
MASLAVGRTVRREIEVAQRRKELTLYFGGGGLGGLGLFGAGDVATGIWARAPHVLLPLFITLILVTGYCLARGYSGYEYRATTLERDIKDGRRQETDDVGDAVSKAVKVYYTASTISLATTASCLLLAVWWAAISPQSTM